VAKSKTLTQLQFWLVETEALQVGALITWVKFVRLLEAQQLHCYFTEPLGLVML
jgi:hypothetical protein